MRTLALGLSLGWILTAGWAVGQVDSPPLPSPPTESPPVETPPAEPPPPSEPPPSQPPPESPPPSPPPSSELPAPPPTAAFPEPPPPAPAPAPPPAPSEQPTPAAPPPTQPTWVQHELPPLAAQPAPQPATSTPATTRAQGVADDDDSGRRETDGVFGPFRIGPVVGIGLPSLFNFGGVIKLTPYFAAGLNIGIVPEVHFAYYGDATVSYQSADLYGHIHPFGGGFFLGAAVGYANVRGTYEDEFDLSAFTGVRPATLPYTSEATVQTLVLTPRLGYFYTFRSGFTFGVDAGAQIPIAPSDITFESPVDADLPQPVVDAFIDPNDERVRSTLERVGQTVLPTIHLRMGWLL